MDIIKPEERGEDYDGDDDDFGRCLTAVLGQGFRYDV